MMDRQKKPAKYMIVTIVILIAIISIFTYLNSKGEKLPEGKVRLTAGNDIIGEISLDEVRKLPAVSKKVVINSTRGLTKHNFTGTPLLEVFNSIDPQITKEYQRVITKGTDNYISGINMEEVMRKNNVILVYEDDGKPLKSKMGEVDTMRIIILKDVFGQRFTNFLVELQLE